jgi:hypothetical protein
MTNAQSFNPPPSFTPPPELGRYQTQSLITGAVALALGLIVALLTANLRGFFFAYLMSYFFWVGISVGCLVWVMIQFVARGSWGVVIRRVGESGTRTLPLMALLFIPIIIGMGYLFYWSHREVIEGDEVLRLKEGYLNPVFFVIRAVIYFAVWLLLAYYLNRWSRQQDQTANPRLTDLMRNLSGPGIVIFGLTVTLAATDWVMSLDPHWYSTIFGIIVMGGWGLSALSFIIIALALLARFEPLRSVLKPNHFHDLGNLLLALVMLWAYFNFSQFIIIWSGNLPEETPWYLRRMRGGWQYVGLAIVVFHFALPFLLLLNRLTKRSVSMLAAIAGMVIFMRLVDTFYLISPEADREHHLPLAAYSHLPGLLQLPLLVFLPVGIGGLWLAFFCWQLRKQPLMPLGDPLLGRVLRRGHE